MCVQGAIAIVSTWFRWRFLSYYSHWRRCSRCSFRQLCDSDDLWRSLYQSRWFLRQLPEFVMRGRTWHSVYIDRYKVEKEHFQAIGACTFPPSLISRSTPTD